MHDGHPSRGERRIHLETDSAGLRRVVGDGKAVLARFGPQGDPTRSRTVLEKDRPRGGKAARRRLARQEKDLLRPLRTTARAEQFEIAQDHPSAAQEVERPLRARTQRELALARRTRRRHGSRDRDDVVEVGPASSRVGERNDVERTRSARRRDHRRRLREPVAPRDERRPVLAQRPAAVETEPAHGQAGQTVEIRRIDRGGKTKARTLGQIERFLIHRRPSDGVLPLRERHPQRRGPGSRPTTPHIEARRLRVFAIRRRARSGCGLGFGDPCIDRPGRLERPAVDDQATLGSHRKLVRRLGRDLGVGEVSTTTEGREQDHRKQRRKSTPAWNLVAAEDADSALGGVVFFRLGLGGEKAKLRLSGLDRIAGGDRRLHDLGAVQQGAVGASQIAHRRTAVAGDRHSEMMARHALFFEHHRAIGLPTEARLAGHQLDAVSESIPRLENQPRRRPRVLVTEVELDLLFELERGLPDRQDVPVPEGPGLLRRKRGIVETRAVGAAEIFDLPAVRTVTQAAVAPRRRAVVDLDLTSRRTADHDLIAGDGVGFRTRFGADVQSSHATDPSSERSDCLLDVARLRGASLTSSFRGFVAGFLRWASSR